jgi:tetratricopeptide (TPR) repeat protein
MIGNVTNSPYFQKLLMPRLTRALLAVGTWIIGGFGMNHKPTAPNKIYNLHAERFYRMAGQLFINGDNYTAALNLIDQAIIASPFDARALVLRGDILYCMSRDEEALISLDQALELNPDCSEAWISKAGVLDTLGMPVDGLRCCVEALKHLKDEDDYMLLCIIDQQLSLLIQLHRYRQAKALLKAAVEEFSSEETQSLREIHGPALDRLGRRRQETLQRAKGQTLRVLPALNQI